MAGDGDTAGGVLFAAFTGKAALVMTRKGTPASTIHSLIDRVSEATPEEIARVEKELFDLQRDLRRMGPAERPFAETQISKLQLRLADIHKPSFLLNEQSRVRDAALVVLDWTRKASVSCGRMQAGAPTRCNFPFLNHRNTPSLLHSAGSSPSLCFLPFLYQQNPSCVQITAGPSLRCNLPSRYHSFLISPETLIIAGPFFL
jgi:hypothetical protein